MPDQPIDEPAERQLGEAGLASERRAFEAWAVLYEGGLDLRGYRGGYDSWTVETAWQAWLASARRKREEVRGG